MVTGYPGCYDLLTAKGEVGELRPIVNLSLTVKNKKALFGTFHPP